MAVVFFDVITFFGVGSFFAWLTFAPLQSDQLDKFKGKERREAGTNFSDINDYFFASFLAFAVAAGCDYLYNNPAYSNYSVTLYDGTGMGFFVGVTTLLWAMFYVRKIVKGDRTWCNVNPPAILYTVMISGFAIFEAYAAIQMFTLSSMPLERLLWFCEIVLTPLGGGLMIMYVDEFQWREKRKRKGIIGLAFLLSPFLLLIVILPLLSFLKL